jgi:hypothetical protein
LKDAPGIQSVVKRCPLRHLTQDVPTEQPVAACPQCRHLDQDGRGEKRLPASPHVPLRAATTRRWQAPDRP